MTLYLFIQNEATAAILAAPNPLVRRMMQNTQNEANACLSAGERVKMDKIPLCNLVQNCAIAHPLSLNGAAEQPYGQR